MTTGPDPTADIPVDLGRWLIFDGADWVPSDLRFQVHDVEMWPRPPSDTPIRRPRQPVESGGIELTPGWIWMPGIYAYTATPSGYFDVNIAGSRSYTGDGYPKPVPGIFPPNTIPPEVPPLPVYHGYYSTRLGGKHHGFVWFPKLGLQYRCSKVEVLWLADHMNHPTDGKISFGYHTLSFPPPDMVIYDEPGIQRNLFQVPFVPFEKKWVELPGMEDLVNLHRRGGFGVVVGHDSFSSLFYGYSRPLGIRYWWSRDTGWQS